MNNTYFGNVLKELRIKKKMSQEKLADGICTKRQLIRIEQNENLPTGFLLSELSKKLNENLEPFLVLAEHPNPIEVIQLKKDLNLYFYQKNLLKIVEVIQEFRITHPELPADFNQYLGWYELVCRAGLPSYEQPQLDCYLQLLELTMDVSDLKQACTGFRTINEINILHSIITTIFLNTGDYKQALNLLLPLKESYIQFYHEYDINILGRMYYNLANVYYRLEDHEEALNTCDQGIELCIREGSFSIVADLYMCKAGILLELNRFDEARPYAKYFVTIYEMQGKREYIEPIISEFRSNGFDV